MNLDFMVLRKSKWARMVKRTIKCLTNSADCYLLKPTSVSLIRFFCNKPDLTKSCIARYAKHFAITRKDSPVGILYVPSGEVERIGCLNKFAHNYDFIIRLCKVSTHSVSSLHSWT